MQRSKVGSITVPAINLVGNRAVGPFYTAGAVPARLYVRNRSGVQIQLAFESNAVNGSAAAQSTSDRFELDEDQDITLYVAPGQSVYAVGAGQGRLSWHAADVAYIDLGGAPTADAGGAGGAGGSSGPVCPPGRTGA